MNINLNFMNKKLIGVTVGDINGIGIHLLIRLWKEKKIKHFILLTNNNLFNKFLIKNKIKLKTQIINKNIKINHGRFFLIYDYFAKNNIENTYKSLGVSHKLYLNNFISGVINLPLNKEKIINKVNKKFIGQTEYYQSLDKKNFANMIFFSKKIISATITTHIPIKKINDFLNKKKLLSNKIIHLYMTLKNDFKINNPKIVFLGLNPHAGENGKIGREEFIIKKILKNLQKNNIYIYGPLPADSIFTSKNIDYFDCFLSMYHDQALIPFKIISKYKGINYTGSLNIIRVSPVHGTGYDLINTQNKGNYESLLSCFKIIKKIIANRQYID